MLPERRTATMKERGGGGGGVYAKLETKEVARGASTEEKRERGEREEYAADVSQG